MLNKIFLHGRLTAVPELRMTQSNKAVCTFTLAVDRDSAQKATDFINCVAWEKRAEFVNNYFTKGQEALVCGSLNMRSYTDKEGNHRTVAEVIVDKVDFCGSKNAARDGDGTERKPTVQEQQQFEELTDDDGELPF
jgi:single-strand DNA-binding protein